MKVQLLQGHFSSEDAIDILTQMIQVKIKFHENKISVSSIEEDIKMREGRIKLLQMDLLNARKYMASQRGYIALQSEINL